MRANDVPIKCLDENSNHSAESRSDRHRWDEDSSRDLAAVRDDDETRPEYCSEQQRVDHAPLSPSSARKFYQLEFRGEVRREQMTARA